MHMVLQVMPSELSNRLKKAFDGSIASQVPEDSLDRVVLRKAAGGGSGALLADVLVLSYSLGRPLAALMPPRVMALYEQISTFLFKSKTVEFKLQQSWLVRPQYLACDPQANVWRNSHAYVQVLRRMERLLQGTLRAHITAKHTMWHVLSLAHRLRADMSGFVRHLLEYSTNKVIEGAWSSLVADIDAVRCPSLPAEKRAHRRFCVS